MRSNPSRFLLLAILLVSSSIGGDAFAQKKKARQPVAVENGLAKIDTLTIGGLRPGDQAAAFKRVTFDLDTVFWQGKQGVNMFKGIATQFGEKGECRISTRDGEIQQVAFNMVFATADKARQTFEELESRITGRFGDPKEVYNNVHQSVKWTGVKRVLALKTVDGASSVSLSLTQIAPATINPKLPQTQGK